jgi:hypothetical protein
MASAAVIDCEYFAGKVRAFNSRDGYCRRFLSASAGEKYRDKREGSENLVHESGNFGIKNNIPKAPLSDYQSHQ